MLKLLMVSLLVLVGCGPTAAEIKTAKQTTYVGDALAIFNDVQRVVAENYKIADMGRTDETYRLVTQEQWYSRRGRAAVGGRW